MSELSEAALLGMALDPAHFAAVGRLGMEYLADCVARAVVVARQLQGVVAGRCVFPEDDAQHGW